MKRAILVPPVLLPGALDELKQWLSISTAQEDELLTALLKGAVDMCEAFTRQMPMEAECEEILPSVREWQCISATPVQAVTGMESLGTDGSRTALAVADYAIDIDANGTARVRLLSPNTTGRLVVHFTAGLAPDWTSLPDGLRQGVIRLAAHNYSQRDLEAADSAPPAAVSALWSPWRRLRLV